MIFSSGRCATMFFYSITPDLCLETILPLSSGWSFGPQGPHCLNRVHRLPSAKALKFKYRGEDCKRSLAKVLKCQRFSCSLLYDSGWNMCNYCTVIYFRSARQHRPTRGLDRQTSLLISHWHFPNWFSPPTRTAKVMMSHHIPKRRD